MIIKHGRKILALLMTCLLLSGASAVSYAMEVSGDDLNQNTSIDDIISKMTTEEKITQCLMMDFRKWNGSDGEPAGMTVLNDDVADIISDYRFGSIILFAENIRKTGETVNLTKDMQAASMSSGGLPLLIATDQEGGIVYRLGSGTALPGNMALGATGNPLNARITGEIIGRELGAVGINTTLAPVLDVNNNANNSVIGIRSFSDNADMVGEFGSEFIGGLDEYNIIGCAKHFPGHGDTATDSHYGLPMVDKSLSELRANELKPFQAAVNKGVDMIMTAHILYPQVDSSTILSQKTGKQESRPATMSGVILKDILRGEMGFSGVVVTDAMNMAGVANFYTPEQAALEALKAGSDIVCMPVTGIYDKAEFIESIDSIISYIEGSIDSEGGLSMDRLDEAVRRVLTLKESKGILDYNPSDYTVDRAVSSVGSDENRAYEREISARAVTLVRNDNNILPYKAEDNARILMLCPYDNERAQMVMGLNRAKEAGKVPESAEVRVYRFSREDNEIKEGGELKEALDWADLVIINSEVVDSEDMSFGFYTSRGARDYTEYCRKNNKKSVILSVYNPYDVQLYPDADAVLAVYGAKGSTLDVTMALLEGEITEDENACGPNITAGVEVLFGVFNAEGRLPVDIPEFADGAFTSNIVYARGYGLSYEADEPEPEPAPAPADTTAEPEPAPAPADTTAEPEPATAPADTTAEPAPTHEAGQDKESKSDTVSKDKNIIVTAVNTKSVKTGDNSHPVLWTMMLLISLLGVTVTLAVRKRRMR